MGRDPRHERGRRGEALAARELRRRGYRIVARNWRCRLGEVDLIAFDGEVVVFVEVKTRVNVEYGGPELAVGFAKQRKLCHLADLYCRQHRLSERVVRFDVVAVQLSEAGKLIACQVFQDAFGDVR